MGKPTNGPDWTDVSTSMYELERDWGISLTVLIELDGSAGGYGLYVHVVGVPAKEMAMFESEGVSVSFRWPHKDHGTFEGMMLGLLMRADNLLDEAAARKPTKA